MIDPRIMLVSEPTRLLGDCLERMKEIPDGSVDLALTDPPYGTWEHLLRIAIGA